MLGNGQCGMGRRKDDACNNDIVGQLDFQWFLTGGSTKLVYTGAGHRRKMVQTTSLASLSVVEILCTRWRNVVR